MNETRLNDGNWHGGARERGASDDNGLPLRAQIARARPETRIFVYALYRARSDGERGWPSAQSSRRAGMALPWRQTTPQDDVPI